MQTSSTPTALRAPSRGSPREKQQGASDHPFGKSSSLVQPTTTRSSAAPSSSRTLGSEMPSGRPAWMSMRQPPPAPFDRWMPLEIALARSWETKSDMGSSRRTARSPKNTARQYERHAQQLRVALEKARLEAQAEHSARCNRELKSSPGSPPRLRQSPNPNRATKGVESYVLRNKLKLREGSALDSRRVGELPMDSIVSVLEQAQLPDGTDRAKVAKFGESTALGWISCSDKDRRSNLIPFHWTRFQRVVYRPQSSASELTTVVADKVEPPSPSPSATPNKARRMSRANSATFETAAAAAAAAEAEPTAEARDGQNTKALANATSTDQLAVATSAVGFAAKAKGARRASVSPEQAEAMKKKRNSITGTMVERFKPQTSEEIQEIVSALQAELNAETNGLNDMNITLQAQLGSAIFTSNIKVADLVKKWTTNAKGIVGTCTKVDFRKYVRTLIDWTNVKEIDSFFTQIDADRNGSLDPSELSGVMNKLIDKARVAAAAAEKVEIRATFLRSRLETATSVATMTADAEHVELRLEALTTNKSIDSRLGAELLRRNAKIGDLTKSWESTDGLVDKKQFRKDIRGFGIEDDDEVIDALFDSMDTNAVGSLDLEEIRTSLSSLREASLESDREVERLKKRSTEQWKAAKVAQLEFKKLRKADEAEAAAKAEQDAAELERRKADHEAKMVELQAKKEEQQRKKEEEKAAYEAKIAMRRASSASGLGAVKVVAGKVVKA